MDLGSQHPLPNVRGVEFKGGSRHNRDRHNRQNRQPPGTAFCRISKRRERCSPSTTETVKSAKVVIKATPLKHNSPFPTS